MNTRSLTDGLLRRNAVLSEGMVIAPVVVLCDTLPKAAMLSLAFAVITILTVVIGSFYPRRLVYTARIILYALTASLIFIPTALLCEYISPDIYAALGTMTIPGEQSLTDTAVMYLPLLTVNSFIVLHSELTFYHLPRGAMITSLFFHTAGVALAACLTGAIREILAYGSIAGHIVDMPLLLRGIASPWAGFIVLGILCALHRAVFPKKGGA